MKALTVIQPYAWAICRGLKRVENRPRRTLYRGRILIHAGLSLAYDHIHTLPDTTEVPPFMARGAIVGEVDIVDCLPVAEVEDCFATGPWCWILTNARAYKKPIKCRGQLGLWSFNRADQASSQLTI